MFWKKCLWRLRAQIFHSPGPNHSLGRRGNGLGLHGLHGLGSEKKKVGVGGGKWK